MLLKSCVLSGAIVLALSYAAYPCATLYALHRAIRSGDTATVARLVDWRSVREGLDQDIADRVTSVSDGAAVSSGQQLAPFGFSFMRGVVHRAVDAEVTPTKVLNMLKAQRGGGLTLRAAYFDSPTEFIVRLIDAHQSEVRVRLNLEEGRWRVTRVWCPLDLIRPDRAVRSLQASAD